MEDFKAQEVDIMPVIGGGNVVEIIHNIKQMTNYLQSAKRQTILCC